MCRYVLLLAIITLTLSTNVSAQPATPEAAVNLFKNALKKTGNGDFDGAIEDYTRAIVLSSRIDASKYNGNRSGNSFAGADDASADNVSIVDPFTASAYTNRGVARYQKGDLEGALADLDLAIRMRPSLATAYLNRAAVHRAVGNLEAALKDLDRANALQKDFFEALSNRGSVRYDLGDTQGALSDLNRAIDLNDRVAEPFYQRGYVYLGLKNFDASMADFERAIKLAPNMAWAYQGRGTVLMCKGQMERAIESFDQAISLDPRLSWAYFNRAVSKIYLGQDPQADVAECLKLRPDLKSELETRLDLAKHLRRIARQD
jgi:tetratricopeptide (TPR) repeat protein